MSEPKLPPEVEASYSAIIDSILAKADLHTISAKAIRKGLQAQVDYDISVQKKAITALIMTRFDKVTAERGHTAASPSEPTEPTPTAKPPVAASTNGFASKESNGTTPPKSTKKRSSPSEEEDDDESQLSSVVDTPPPKKKHKPSRSVEDSDAAFAARLQAEENKRAARSTRGGGTTKRKPIVKKSKKERKKKSSARVGSDEDSEAGSGEKKEVKRSGGFHKPMALSPALSALLNGETQLSRPQTVKKIWEYIKANELQDPSDKRQIRCDDAMRTVFKTDRVHMFTMNKILNQNLYAVDE